MTFITLIIAVVVILLAARHPTGPNTVSYEEPAGLLIAIGMVIVLFLPLLILSLFSHRVVRIISAVCQTIVVISFLGIIPIGFLFPQHFGVSIIAFFGFLTSIASVVVTLKTDSNREVKF